MIDREIMSELEEKIKKSTIYSRIQKIRREFGYAITREEASYILAGNLGVDIAKYLPGEELKNIRKLIQNLPIGGDVIATKNEPRSKKEVFEIKIKGININLPFLPKIIAKQSHEMSENYQSLYIFENLIRFFIRVTLESKYGTDWWDVKVPSKIVTKVKNRKEKENENRWHSKRNVHNIFYTDFGDLKDVIISNWDIFEDFFPDQHWIASKLQELELSRNIIAHNNPLPKKETDRIKLYFEDWRKQVKLSD